MVKTVIVVGMNLLGNLSEKRAEKQTLECTRVEPSTGSKECSERLG